MTKRIIGLLTALLLVGSLFASCKNESETEDGDEISGDFSIDVTDDGAMSPKQIFEKCFTVGKSELYRFVVVESEKESVTSGESDSRILKSTIYFDSLTENLKNEYRFGFDGEYFDFTVFSDKSQSVVNINGFDGNYIVEDSVALDSRNVSEFFAALYAVSAYYEKGGFDSCISFAENLKINGKDYENSSGVAFKAENIVLDEKYTLTATVNAVVENDKAVASEASVSIAFPEEYYYEKISLSVTRVDNSFSLTAEEISEGTNRALIEISGGTDSGKGKLTNNFISDEESGGKTELEFSYSVKDDSVSLNFDKFAINGIAFDTKTQVIIQKESGGITLTATKTDGALTLDTVYRIRKSDSFEIAMPENPIDIETVRDGLIEYFRENYPTLSDHMGLTEDLNGDGGEDGIIELSDGNGTYILNSENNNGVYMTSFTIGQDSIVLNDKREIPLNYSELTYDEEGGKHIATINGRKYEISEYTDPDGTLCQSLICIDDIENLDFTASVLFYPELEYGDISLGFVYEIAKNGTEYTFTYPDGHKETRTVEFDSTLGRYVFTDIEMTIE
ncbi:MAG: hypothetical protein E7595_06985 [Ruminococcaceae bacterium]|nr:hypothetical protein [Oscillospiraceae bacterium]